MSDDDVTDDLIDAALDQVREAFSNTDTLIAFLLDRSGSMATIRQATIDGFNEFRGEQSKQPGNAWVSLFQFDTEFQTDYEAVPIDQTDYLSFETFEPRGSTALYDGIAKMITRVENSVEEMTSKPASVLLVIMTDGAENASREHNAASVKALIEAKQQNGWDFVYLGANVDAFHEANRVGIPKGFAAQYASSQSSTQAAFATTSSSTLGYRSTSASRGGQSLTSTGGTFFEPDEQDLTNK